MLVHKGGQIKNWGEECRDVTPAVSKYTKSTAGFFTMISNFQSPNLKREIIKKKKNIFFLYPSINLLIILYQLAKFEAPSCNTFQDIMITNFQSPNLQREIIREKKIK